MPPYDPSLTPRIFLYLLIALGVILAFYVLPSALMKALDRGIR